MRAIEKDPAVERIEENLGLLRCPRCRDNAALLVLDREAVRCARCGTQYPIVFMVFKKVG